MATDKTFTVVGSSTQEGKTKIRFANDVMRIKILAKNGHTDINLVELPQAMTKVEAVKYLQAQNFGDGNMDIQAAIAHVLKANKASAEAASTKESKAAEEVTI